MLVFRSVIPRVVPGVPLCDRWVAMQRVRRSRRAISTILGSVSARLGEKNPSPFRAGICVSSCCDSGVPDSVPDSLGLRTARLWCSVPLL